MPNAVLKSWLGRAILLLTLVSSLQPPASQAAQPNIAGSNSALQVSALPVATVGQPYNATLFIGGGTAPYKWTGTGLPAGLKLSTSGVLSGTPTAATTGPTSFSVQVADSSKTPLTVSATFGIIVQPAPAGLHITPATLPAATVGQSYKETLTVAGGTAPYKFALAAGSTAPAGLTLSVAGVLSGTPTTATAAGSTDSFAVTVTDSSANPLKATATLQIAINAASNALTVTSLTLPTATVAQPYSTQLSASGGVGPYFWSFGPNSQLPAGLNWSPSGMISGTPTAATPAGGVSLSVTVTDSSPNHMTASASVLLKVVVSSVPLTVVTKPQLPPAYVGANYQLGFQASGGTPPYNWTLASGETLPSGLFFSANALSGTPRAAVNGPVKLALTLTDSSPNPQSITGNFIFNVFDPAADCSHDGSGNARLKGQYALALSGNWIWDGSHPHILGSFTADGVGTIANGSADVNAPEAPGPDRESFQGSYSIGSSDSRGVLNPTGQGIFSDFNSGPTYCFVADRIGADGVATSGSLIRADESGYDLAGTFQLQNPQAFTVGSLKGNFTFGLQGSSLDPATKRVLRAALAGYLTFDGTGKITAGEADMSQQRFSQPTATTPAQIVNKTDAQVPLTGTYTVANTGRGTIQLVTPDNTLVNFAIQVISNSELRLLEIDGSPTTSNCCSTVLAGKATLQSVAKFSNASLSGTSVFLSNGVANVGASNSGQDLEVGLLTFDGKGNVTVVSDEDAAGSVKTQNTSTATYSVDPAGRVTVQVPANTTGGGGQNLPTLYLSGQNQAFGVNSSTGVQFIEILPQSSTTIKASSSYGIGTVWPSEAVSLQSGSVLLGTSGSVTATMDSNQSGAISIDQTQDAAVTGGKNGRYVFTPAGQTTPQAALYVVSTTEAYALDISGSGAPPALRSLAPVLSPPAPATK